MEGDNNDVKSRKRHKKKKSKPASKLAPENDLQDDESFDKEKSEDKISLRASPKSDQADSDSDNDNKPKRKKKKKQLAIPAEGTGNKNKKSIRQSKREKFAQRQSESLALAKDHMKSECLSYLSEWKHNRQNWKFMKVKQLWLFKNKFFDKLVPNESWPMLLEYFESAKGNIRNMLLNDANNIIKQMDDWIETNNSKEDKEENEDESEDSEKPSESVYKRARDLIQFLQE